MVQSQTRSVLLGVVVGSVITLLSFIVFSQSLPGVLLFGGDGTDVTPVGNTGYFDTSYPAYFRERISRYALEDSCNEAKEKVLKEARKEVAEYTKRCNSLGGRSSHPPIVLEKKFSCGEVMTPADVCCKHKKYDNHYTTDGEWKFYCLKKTDDFQNDEPWEIDGNDIIKHKEPHHGLPLHLDPIPEDMNA